MVQSCYESNLRFAWFMKCKVSYISACVVNSIQTSLVRAVVRECGAHLTIIRYSSFEYSLMNLVFGSSLTLNQLLVVICLFMSFSVHTLFTEHMLVKVREFSVMLFQRHHLM